MIRQTRPRLTIRKYSQRSLFIFTKSIAQILLWQILTTAIYFAGLEATQHRNIFKIKDLPDWSDITKDMIIKFLFLVYPIGTLVGDLCLGRYKTVISSLVIVSVSMLLSSIGAILLFVHDGITAEGAKTLQTASMILNIIAAPVFLVGFSIFNSTIIQFGLDQLIDKPSESLGVFVHWLVWAMKFGIVIVKVIYIANACVSHEITHVFKVSIQSLPICFLVLLLVFLLLSWCTRHHLNHDSVLYNPYKMIYTVFRFAQKNKYLSPVSAFSSNSQLTRLDYAKERYGGPFKNSDVEDVKYFKRVFIILFALGPVFVLSLPLNVYFHFFSTHTGVSVSIQGLNSTCSSHLDIEFFSEVTGVFVLPIYIWITYSLFRNRRPKILHRLLLLALMYILGALSMFVIDSAGHLDLYTHELPQPMCLFQKNTTTTLHMHWAVMVFPSVTNGIYYLLLATSLEFISAQSPHSMRGVLVGVFYFIVGIFRLLSLVLFIPFRLNSIWRYGYLGHHPPVINCGFGYYLVCITIAFTGFVLLVFAVKWYQYRRRDEESFPRLQEAVAVNTPRRRDYQELKN